MSVGAHAVNAASGARLAAALLLALTIGRATVAHAGPVEQFVQLALHPKNPDVMLLRYENGGDGVFYTRDRGKNWTMMCGSAIEASLIGGLSIGVAGDGTALFAGELGGSASYSKTLWEDDAHGCGFARIDALADTWISDIVADPTDGDVLFGVSSGFDHERRNGLWKRAADGAWSELGPRERIMISRLRIATTSSGLRMYESALREISAADAGADSGAHEYGFVIRVSDDGGKTWKERPFEQVESGASLRLEAIDPKNPDAIVVALNSPDALGVPWEETKDHLLVSEDRGATFREYLALAEVGGVVFDADGRLWVGDAGNLYDKAGSQGLWTAKSLEEPATKVADVAIQCLAFQPATDTLYACQRQSLSSVDRTHDGELTPLLRAVTAPALASCAGTDVKAACEMQLCGAYCGPAHFAQAPLCEAYDTPFCGPAVATNEVIPDAGAGVPERRDVDSATRDAAITDAAPEGAGNARLTGTGSDCGCAVVGGRATNRTGIACSLALLFVAARRLGRRRYW